MTDKEIVERAKEAEKRTGFGELVHSPISKGVNSAFGIGFIEGMVEYRNSMQEEPESHKPKITLGEATGKLKIDDFTRALAECINQAQCAVVDPMAHAEIWKDELIKLAKGKEPVSEEWIEELRTKLDSMSKEDFKKVFDKYAVDFNEEPVSEKKCIFTKDSYTDEDRKVLCEDCKEKCGYSKKEEPVSEELEKVALEYATHYDKNWSEVKDGYIAENEVEAFKAGAKWQKKQMMANTADAMIGLPYENKDGGYTHLIDVSRPLPVGNNKIAIIFKED